MKRKFRSAYCALKRIGVPVFTNEDTVGPGNFKISAEQNYETSWADYYMEYGNHMNNEFPGFHKDICDILQRYGLYPEWENPGVATVWEG